MTNLLQKTTSEPKPAKSGPKSDPIVSKGVGLRKSEWAEVKQIAAGMGTTYHALAVYGLRYFLQEYKAGKIKTETKQTLSGL